MDGKVQISGMQSPIKITTVTVLMSFFGRVMQDSLDQICFVSADLKRPLISLAALLSQIMNL